MRRAVASVSASILAVSLLVCAGMAGLASPSASAAQAGAPKAAATSDQNVGGFEDPGEGWQLSLGTEFPGAAGELTRDGSAAHSGSFSGRTHADFSGGGNYVEAFRGLDSLDLQALSFWVETADANRIGLRLTDSTGQVHQQQFDLSASTDWQRVDVTSFGSPSSHWGGANDGVWHGPATRIGIITDKAYLTAGKTSGDVYLDDVVVSVPVPDLVLRQTALGNVFTDGQQVAFDIDTTGDAVSWTAHDFWGATVAAGTASAGGGAATVRPVITKHGYYRLDVTAKRADGSVLATAATTFALLAPFDVAKVPSSPFGIGTHFTGYSDDLIPLLAKAGIKNVRNDLGWGAIETTKGEYTFQTYDKTMRGLDDAGISVLPIVDYTNPLYDGDATPYSDAGRAGFAAYAGAMLQHYKDQLDAVEVYNEFNIPGFGDRGDGPADAKAEYYYPLLAATAPKLQAADPDAAVVGPASAGVPLAWMETLFQLGGLRSLDAVSIHPYQYPSAPESVVTNLDAVQDLVKKYNDGQPKPLWITEQGWPTHTGATGVSEQTQAAYLVRAYAMALSHGVQKFFWYDFMNDGTDPAYNENNFGIIRNTGDAMGRWVPKPAYVAYATMARQLTGATFGAADDLGASTWSMRFDRGDKAVRVMWSADPTTVTIKTDRPVAVTDLTGDTRTYEPGVGDTVALSLSGDPVYVSSGSDARVTAGSRFELRPASDVFVGNPVRLTLTVDNTAAPQKRIDGAFQIAGQQVAVSVPGGSKADIPVTLPAEPAAGVRKVAGDLVVKGSHVARLGTAVNVRLPVSLSATHVLADGGEMMRFSVHNLSSSQVRIDGLDWTIGDRTGTALAGETVDGGASRVSDIPLAGLAAGTYPLRADLAVTDVPHVTQTGKVVIVPSDKVTTLAAKSITVDGTLDDLSGVPGIDLATDGRVVMSDYGGTSDLSGAMWFTWDDDNLYLSARIRDDTFTQTETGGNIWQGDGIQFAVTPGSPGEVGYGYEYGVALTSAGPQAYRWSAIEGDVGPVTDVPLAVRRDEANKETVYELALPWSKLAPTVASDGMLSLSMLVNDNDGGGRKGYIEWGSGIGTGKDAALFKAVRLAR